MQGRALPFHTSDGVRIVLADDIRHARREDDAAHQSVVARPAQSSTPRDQLHTPNQLLLEVLEQRLLLLAGKPVDVRAQCVGFTTVCSWQRSGKTASPAARLHACTSAA